MEDGRPRQMQYRAYTINLQLIIINIPRSKSMVWFHTCLFFTSIFLPDEPMFKPSFGHFYLASLRLKFYVMLQAHPVNIHDYTV